MGQSSKFAAGAEGVVVRGPPPAVATPPRVLPRCPAPGHRRLRQPALLPRRGLRGGRGRMSQSSGQHARVEIAAGDHRALALGRITRRPRQRQRNAPSAITCSSSASRTRVSRSSASRTMTMSSSRSAAAAARGQWPGRLSRRRPGGHRLTRCRCRRCRRACHRVHALHLRADQRTPCDTAPVRRPRPARRRRSAPSTTSGISGAISSPTVPWPAITSGSSNAAAGGSRAAPPARRQTPSPRRSCRRAGARWRPNARRRRSWSRGAVRGITVIAGMPSRYAARPGPARGCRRRRRWWGGGRRVRARPTRSSRRALQPVRCRFSTASSRSVRRSAASSG